MIRLETLKAGSFIFEQAVKTALNFDSSIYGSAMFNLFRPPVNNLGPQPMDIENIERKRNILETV